MATSSDSGPLVPLTRTWRVGLALLAVALALGHLLLPHLPIDALFLGLLIVAVALVFFDIESFEFAGIKARRQKEELKEAKESLQQVEMPAKPPAVLLPPERAEPPLEGEVSLGYGGLVHRPAAELAIPSDRLERLLWAYEQTRIELIVIAASSGHLPDRKRWEDYTVPELGTLLSGKGVIPSGLSNPLLTTVDVRNSIVHTGLRPTSSVLLNACEVALETLATLRRVKRNYIRIVVPNLSVYKDQSLSAFVQNTGAVMIAQITDEGVVSHVGVYPRYISYVRGRFVSWEWDLGRVFHEPAWYEDSETKTAKMAWGSSSTFIGREFPQQWGLEYRLPRPDVGLA